MLPREKNTARTPVGIGDDAPHAPTLAAMDDRRTAALAAVDGPGEALPERPGPRSGGVQSVERAFDLLEAIADAGGVDVQLLGVGTDGHIAFNEPGSSLASRTRIKTLTSQTRRDNARFFDGDVEAVPQHCLTQGIGTILEARHLVLLATGSAKAEAVHNLVEGAVSAMWPATALQLHPHATVILDTAAASRLQLKDYYREAYAVKPPWQGF